MLCPWDAGVWAAIIKKGPNQYYNSKPQVDGIKAFLEHLCLHGKVLAEEGVTAVASIRSRQKLPPLAEPMSAGSRMDQDQPRSNKAKQPVSVYLWVKLFALLSLDYID